MEHFPNPQELQQAITKLPPKELAAFRAWFVEYDLQTWDADIENDAKSGRLDSFITEAKEHHKTGKATPL